jgi:hypothetical protein
MGEIDNFMVSHKGVTFRVDLDHDYDVRPDEFDCYSDRDMELWRNDEWQYVDVKVTPVVGGVDWEDAAFYLGGVNYGDGDGWSVGVEDIKRRAVEEGWCDEAAGQLRKLAAGVIAALQSFTKEES